MKAHLPTNIQHSAQSLEGVHPPVDSRFDCRESEFLGALDNLVPAVGATVGK